MFLSIPVYLKLFFNRWNVAGAEHTPLAYSKIQNDLPVSKSLFFCRSTTYLMKPASLISGIISVFPIALKISLMSGSANHVLVPHSNDGQLIIAIFPSWIRLPYSAI